MALYKIATENGFHALLILDAKNSFWLCSCLTFPSPVHSAVLGHALEDGLPLNVVLIVRLDLRRDAVKAALDRLLGSRVNHASLTHISR